MTKGILQPDGSIVDAVEIAGGALSKVARISTTLTRVADNNAYASGDLIANSVTAGSVVPMTFAPGRIDPGNFCIRRLKLKKSDPTLTNASFRLHLYTATPTPTNGDNGAWLTTESGYLGFIDVTVDKAFVSGATGGAVGFSAVTEINVALASGVSIYGLLEARAGYGGAAANAEVFTPTLEIWQN